MIRKIYVPQAALKKNKNNVTNLIKLYLNTACFKFYVVKIACTANYLRSEIGASPITSILNLQVVVPIRRVRFSR